MCLSNSTRPLTVEVRITTTLQTELTHRRLLILNAHFTLIDVFYIVTSHSSIKVLTANL